MTEDRDHYNRVSDILAGARECRDDALEAYLDGACGGHAPLRAEILELLALGRDDAVERDAFGEQGIAHARLALEALVDGATDTWLPDVIGSYRIVRQIGHGGMGLVYEATQQSPKRSVAIKLLQPIHATPERLRRFRREADMLGRLQHPGIAQIFEASTYDIGHGAQPFFAMELVDGTDIRTHCERAGLDQRARIELLAEVADAVDYAHSHGIVHRDLKPDNVLVNGRGRPRVLDFGIGHVTGDTPFSTLMTREGQLVGTLGYMAPEQLTAESNEVTPSVDVYSLGVLGFELLTRRLPFGVADQPISKAIVLLTTTEAPPASRFEPSLEGDLDTILGKALEADPARRYPSAAALAGDLRRHLRHEPIQARPPSRVYLATKFARRHRGLVAGALATLVTLLAGSAVSLLLAHEAGRQRDLAQQRERVANSRLLQSAQILIDAGRECDALTQLRLVPEEMRGAAWRLLARAAPVVLDVPPTMACRFVGDEQLVTVSDGALLVHSLLDHGPARVLFADLGIEALGRAARSGLVVAATRDESLLLDLASAAIVARSPRYTVRALVPAPPELGAGMAPFDHEFTRLPEVSDEGRTVLWYTSPTDAEVRVEGAVVRAFRNLEPVESVHLGADGRVLVVNRMTEVQALEVATGAVLLTRARDPVTGPSGFPVRGGVLLCNRPEPVTWTVRTTWSLIALEDDPAPREASAALAEWVVPTNFGSLRASWTDDGHVVAVSSANGGSRGGILGDPRTGLLFRLGALGNDEHGDGVELEFRDGRTAHIEIFPTGRRVATYTAYAETEVRELEAREGAPGLEQRVTTLRGHTDESGALASGWIYHVVVSHDGSLIALAAPRDPLLRLWDARTGEQVGTLARDCYDYRELNSGTWESLMAFSASDDRLLLTTPYGGQGLCLVDWDLCTGATTLHAAPLPRDQSHLLLLDRFIEVLQPAEDARLSQRVQMHGEQALVAFEPPTPGLHEMARPTPGRRWRYVPGVEGHAPGLSAHPRLPRVAVVEQVGLGVARTGELRVVDAHTGRVLARRELEYTPWCVAYSPDGESLAVGTHEGHVLLFDTEHLEQELDWTAHAAYVYSLVWTPDGTRLVTASGDETLRVWDTRTRASARDDADRWRALRAALSSRADLEATYPALAGEERAAARVELIRRAGSR